MVWCELIVYCIHRAVTFIRLCPSGIQVALLFSVDYFGRNVYDLTNVSVSGQVDINVTRNGDSNIEQASGV